jgi:dipeptidyl aminopeptidase/acylaminoacyl peptidase
MRRFVFLGLTGILIGAVGVATACSMLTEPPPEEGEPTFAPGEYGGDPLPGTEYLSNVKASPSGDRYALIRKRTPGEPSDPRNQLWVVGQDGANPRLVGVNILGADWHPDGDRVSVTVATGIDFYVYTINLKTMESTQWTGKDNQRLSFPVVSSSGWFKDGRRLLVFVAQKAYQQPFPRGLYVIDTQDSTTVGPLVELFEAVYFGNKQQYVVGQKYVRKENPRSGNFARYDFADSSWQWITAFPEDSLRHVEPPTPSPISQRIVQSRKVQNADQLFLMDKNGESLRRVTEMGGDNPRWSPNGSSFVFRRDVHRGEGARYVPFRFDLERMEAEPLWPALPDSVPDFPDLSTQSLDKTLHP